MKPDKGELRAWYREAMGRRIEELRELRDGLMAGDAAARDAARRVGQALRGSGGTFGFPRLTAAAELVETSASGDLARRVEGLIEHLHEVRSSADPDEPPIHAEWLTLAAGVSEAETPPFSDPAGAWKWAAERSGLPPAVLAQRVAMRLGLEVADLTRPDRAALRLIPEALMREWVVLPLREDAATVVVASADPTSLSVELEVTRLTGRVPVFVVAPPDALEAALAALLDWTPGDTVTRRRSVAESGDGVGKILVVDDEGTSRLLARRVLEKRGYTVVEAGHGVEALDRLRREGPVSLVVADLHMPEMDGLELLWEIRGAADLAEIPVIVLTVETDEVLEAKLIEEGADDYVCKPLDSRRFVARVGATIRRAEA